MNKYLLKFDIFKALGKWDGKWDEMLNEPSGIQQVNHSYKKQKKTPPQFKSTESKQGS